MALSAMIAESDPVFFSAMCSYLPAWQGQRTPAASVYRIHGKNDYVIPCPSAGCDVIDGAGHLLAITHPGETAAFLEKVRTKVNT
jgi:hypothetical protein